MYIFQIQAWELMSKLHSQDDAYFVYTYLQSQESEE